MKRSTLILIGILIVLAIATYLVLHQPGEMSSSGPSEDLLVQYDSAAVDKLQISAPVGSVTLALEGGQWMIVAPSHHRADANAVAIAVGRGRNIQVTGLVSTNPEKQSVFQVDSLGTLVRVFERGTEKAAFTIGKPGPVWTDTYVRRDGSTDVLVAQGPLSYIFAKSPKDWRDHTIFKTDETTLRSVRFQYGDTTFTLQRQDSLWKVNDTPATEATVRGLLGSLTNLRTDDFIDTVYTPAAAPAALIDAGGTQIRFFRDPATGKYAVQTSRDSQWYLIEEWKAQQVLKRQKDFLSTAP